MERAERIHRTNYAQQRRHITNEIVEERRENFYSKMRRLRKKKSKQH